MKSNLLTYNRLDSIAHVGVLLRAGDSAGAVAHAQ